MPTSSVTKNRIKSICLILALFLYYGIVFVLSHLPGGTLAQFGFVLWDKALHAMLYFPMGVLVSALAYRLKNELPKLYVVVLGIGVVLVLGTLDEFHQFFIPGRSATVSDVVADVVGGGLGIAATLILKSRRSN